MAQNLDSPDKPFHATDKPFPSTGFSRIPNYFFDTLLGQLSNAELRTLLYIFRRTYGFGKCADAISYSQFTEGICSKTGQTLDLGTGLTRKSVTQALDRLVQRGLISRQTRIAPNGACLTSVYRLNFEAIPVPTPSPQPVPQGQTPPAFPACQVALPVEDDEEFWAKALEGSDGWEDGLE